ncbi:MAG: hypothetical protein PHT97_11430 [Methanoculleus sp.]|uniref:hypothetical protein n=1 Tax=Methanoculleus sp. TaxID=90427 RepID=UPI002620AFC2|nr:hypothetical protein [Methanoculleus sp.]MDD2259274.1 hypothetical protein [Bacilli bacterium]MDD4471755.1 hypothetical protein [Methanoculleus sp.]
MTWVDIQTGLEEAGYTVNVTTGTVWDVMVSKGDVTITKKIPHNLVASCKFDLIARELQTMASDIMAAINERKS